MADPDRRYKNVSWSTGDIPTKEKLNQMTSNDNWLFENMPKAVYNTAGIKRASGIKLLAGTTPYPASTTDWVDATTSFGNFFSPGCKPVVVSTVSTAPSSRKFVTIQSVEGTEQIDHRGFKARVSNYEWLFDGGKDRVIKRGGLIMWIAIGY